MSGEAVLIKKCDDEQALEEALQSGLRHVAICFGFADSAAATAASLISRYPVETLFMISQMLTDDRAETLMGALRGNAALRRLHLVRSGLTDASVHSIAHLLRSESNLATLVLTGNDLSDDGVEVIAACLRSNTRLRVLDLGANRISARGLRAVALAVASNPASGLRSLDLRSIPLSLRPRDSPDAVSEAVAAVTDLVQSHRSLTFIGLREAIHVTSRAEAMSVLRAASRSRALLSLHINLCDDSSDSTHGEKRVAEALRVASAARMGLVLLGAPTRGERGKRGLGTRQFFADVDGDHAIWCRVASFL